MIGLNALAVAGAAAYLGACPGLYLSGTQAKRGAWFSALFLMVLAAPWIDRPGLGILRIFFMSGFLFHFCAWSQGKGNFLPHGSAAALFLGGCAATRSEFLCLLLPFFFLAAAGWIRNGNPVYRKGTLVALLALAISLPWQVYDYAEGGCIPGEESPAESFYTLTLPEAQWLGDAVPLGLAGTASLDRDHESAFWKQGLKNVKAHPGKFIQNWRANCNRIAFDFPYSRTAGRPAANGTGNRAFAASALLLLSALSLYPWVRARKTLPREALLVSTWIVAGLGLRSFLSAGADILLPWVPCLLLVICLGFEKALHVRMRSDSPAGAI